MPNDPLFSGQTGYVNTIEATSAWDVERGDSSVAVAILDSGIDLEHSDLHNKLWTNPLEMPGNGIDDDHNGCIDDVHGCSLIKPEEANASCNMPADGGVRDDNGHGTFVAGIIGAEGNNGIGISGAAPGVSIMTVKILDCLGGGTAADAAQGLLYAAHIGARVANLSFGADGDSITLTNAIREAFNVYGMVIVTATGNDGHSSVTFPARLPEALAVGSSGTPQDPSARSPFSNWGPEVDVVAPGLNIISTVPANFCNVTWLCVQNTPYALASGTSFAAPLVSALAALIDLTHAKPQPGRGHADHQADRRAVAGWRDAGLGWRRPHPHAPGAKPASLLPRRAGDHQAVTPKAWAILFMVGGIWGSSFLFTRVSLREVSPLQVVMFRTLLGGLVLACVVLLSRQSLNLNLRRVAALVALAFVTSITPLLLIAWAQTHISSGTAAVLNATMPIFTLLLAAAFLEDERFTGRAAAGVSLGVVGVVLISGGGGFGESTVLSALAVVAASACFAAGNIMIRFLVRDVAGVVVSSCQIPDLGRPLLLAVSAAVDPPRLDLSWKTWGSMAALGVLGTGLAYIGYYWLIEHAGSFRASLVTYVIPVVGVVLGAIVLSEAISRGHRRGRNRDCTGHRPGNGGRDCAWRRAGGSRLARGRLSPSPVA